MIHRLGADPMPTTPYGQNSLSFRDDTGFDIKPLLFMLGLLGLGMVVGAGKFSARKRRAKRGRK